MRVEYAGRPADWVADRGRPARVVGPSGMPAFEDRARKYVVLELLLAMADRDGALKLYPRSYGRAAAGSPESSLVHLHLNEELRRLAIVYSEREVDVIETRLPPPRMWRPVLYFLRAAGWCAMGSQRELVYRHGLNAMMRHLHTGTPRTTERWEAERDRALERAGELLRASLSAQQRIEYAATGDFRVRGGATGNVYRVEVGDGFRLLQKSTGKTIAAYCLHTESWIPDADVALATKLALEDPELEVECLENASARAISAGRRPTPLERRAADMERELIC